MSDRCPRCEGCGLLADTPNQEPWTAWTALPLASSAAVLFGLVKPIPCPDCGLKVGDVVQVSGFSTTHRVVKVSVSGGKRMVSLAEIGRRPDSKVPYLFLPVVASDPVIRLVKRLEERVAEKLMEEP